MENIIKENKIFHCNQKNLIFKIYYLIFIILYGILNLLIYNIKIKTFKFLIKGNINDFQINKPINFNYFDFNFVVIRRTRSPTSGLFPDYKYFLGCVRYFLIQGFIPIIDFESYKNSINGFKVIPLKGNPWEYYFNQPFKYTVVKRKVKNIKYFECRASWIIPNSKIFFNKKSMNYWHNMAKRYIPIKKEIINMMKFVVS